ncbi:hypothetical protein JCM19037_2304 [Geomicrobium sp. JCM 19037]|uniref:hypothetical protein n=1 Tax=unclassified Geomicrobium TaxID=2628951 RepID=UPI00045F1DD8|nr:MULTISPECIES: hypothetical protein [unclassified Geomicrobium]GAK03941.1 hypothetical protein JCM19037_2304 [Geomicrobium sp. JCM 19037]GAK14581.1 hypothetical protein JCM19039_4515 [Geomicrobium sp. JCM 19039]
MKTISEFIAEYRKLPDDVKEVAFLYAMASIKKRDPVVYEKTVEKIERLKGQYEIE